MTLQFASLKKVQHTTVGLAIRLAKEFYLLISKQSKYWFVRNSKSVFHILNGLFICLSWLLKCIFLRHTYLQYGLLLLDAVLHYFCTTIGFSLYIIWINSLGYPPEGTMIRKVCQNLPIRNILDLQKQPVTLKLLLYHLGRKHSIQEYLDFIHNTSLDTKNKLWRKRTNKMEK